MPTSNYYNSADVSATNRQQHTPLHKALSRPPDRESAEAGVDGEECVRLLLEHGACK